MSECCQEPREGSPESLARLCGPNAAGRQLNVAQHLAVALLWLYKTAVSPLLMSCCKFHPTCSAYAREAIERHGFLRGSRMAAGRVLRCRPFAPGGFDPVPE